MKRFWFVRRRGLVSLLNIRTRVASWVVSTVLVVSSADLAIGGEGESADARPVLEQWVQTRQLISKTRSEWQSEKDAIEQSILMFERELRNLTDQLANVSTNRTRADEEREAVLDQQRELNAALERARELAAVLEQRVRALAPAFPAPLLDKVQPLINRIPADPAKAKAGPVERLQNVVSILNEADKFNAAVTVVSELRKDTTGAEVQVETIYVGLAQAYFVDKSGRYAGVGAPSANGWQWFERPELAERIRKAIAVYKNAVPATFVALPVQIR
ncbi:MAG: DUF3450 family protein [Verrucomicrobiales bacterium]|nr:DUF3450 family protein [Verrucomicrobiales bacterium]